MKYQGRVAVVTGAGSGIGRALTQALTAGGAHVAASDIDDNGLAETQASCGPGQVTPYRVDVADRDAVLGFADEVRRKHGPASMVFNNAGVDLFASVADMSWEDFDWLMGINVGGVVNGTKAFLPQLIEAGSDRRPSRLVNLSSAFGLIAVPYQGAYSTSKFAVRGFTEALRQEMIIERHPVTVHCVHPESCVPTSAPTCAPRTPRIPTWPPGSSTGRRSPPRQGRPAHPARRREEPGPDPDRGRRTGDGGAAPAARCGLCGPAGACRAVDRLPRGPLRPLTTSAAPQPAAIGAWPRHIVYCNNYSMILRRSARSC